MLAIFATDSTANLRLYLVFLEIFVSSSVSLYARRPGLTSLFFSVFIVLHSHFALSFSHQYSLQVAGSTFVASSGVPRSLLAVTLLFLQTFLCVGGLPQNLGDDFLPFWFSGSWILPPPTPMGSMLVHSTTPGSDRRTFHLKVLDFCTQKKTFSSPPPTLVRFKLLLPAFPLSLFRVGIFPKKHLQAYKTSHFWSHSTSDSRLIYKLDHEISGIHAFSMLFFWFGFGHSTTYHNHAPVLH